MKFSKGIWAFIVIVVLTVVFLKFHLLSVGQVTIRKSGVDCATDEQLESSLKLKGQNIFFIDENGLQEKLIGKFPCIRSVEFNKVFPDKIVVEVSAREALANVASFTLPASKSLATDEATPSSQSALLDWSFPNLLPEASFLIDKDGFIFKQGERTDLPALFLNDASLKVGEKIDPNTFNKISTVFGKIRDLQASDSTNFSSNSSFVAKVDDTNLLIKDGLEIAISLNRDILRQLASLQLILQKAKIDEKTLENVDLRFDRPVVIYEPKKGKS